jgi:hypothetical protein
MSELEEVSSEAIWSAFFIPWKHFERGEQMVLECLEKYHFPRTLKKAIKANLT